MNTARLFSLAACAALLLAACSQRPPMTPQDVKSVVGMSMSDVDAKLGRANSITDAGDSTWWEYINITMPNGNTDGSCHVVFRRNVAVEVKC